MSSYLLDPALAPLRCWGHDDCLQDVALALCCTMHRIDLPLEIFGHGGHGSYPHMPGDPDVREGDPSFAHVGGDGFGVSDMNADWNYLLTGDGAGTGLYSEHPPDGYFDDAYDITFAGDGYNDYYSLQIR